jgi:hypothetical protein
MRIKKQDIIENNEKAKKIAQNTINDVKNIVNDLKTPLTQITGDEESSKKIATKIAADSIERAYDKQLEEVGPSSVHTTKFDKCVASVEKKSNVDNPYAICQSSLGSDAIKKSHRRKPESQYENTGEDFGDMPTNTDLEVRADDYEKEKENLELFKQDNEKNKNESVRNRISKNELIESLKINEGDPNDNKLTVGELRQSLEILKKAKNKEEAIASAKSIGKDVLRIVGAFLTMGQSETASLIANVAVDGAGLVGKLLDPKSPPEKNPDPFMQQLQIDPNVSKLLDDKVEYDFIKYAENGLKNMSDDDEIPNFFNELQKFIRDKYTTDYNVSKSINLKKKNESVRPSMTKDELIETVNKLRNTKKRVIKTIKVKDIKI